MVHYKLHTTKGRLTIKHAPSGPYSCKTLQMHCHATCTHVQDVSLRDLSIGGSALGEEFDGSEMDCDPVSLTCASNSLRHVQSVLHPQLCRPSARPWIINTNISAWSRYVRQFMMRDSIPTSRLLYTAGTAMQRTHTFRRSAYVTETLVVLRWARNLTVPSWTVTPSHLHVPVTHCGNHPKTAKQKHTHTHTHSIPPCRKRKETPNQRIPFKTSTGEVKNTPQPRPQQKKKKQKLIAAKSLELKTFDQQ